MLGPSDEGALNIGVARDSKGNVVINFGTEVSWVAMPAQQAIELAALLMKNAGAKKVVVEGPTGREQIFQLRRKP